MTRTFSVLVLLTGWLLASTTLLAQDSTLRIEIRKADRTLILFDGDEVRARYRIGLGFDPVSDKTRQGDGATPEGEYSVCVKNPQSRYYLSVGLSYPNADDAAQALRDGQIDEATHRRVVRALKRGVCPPWDTPLGGEIYIHGRGADSDWTLGCIALDDPDMKTLFDTVPVGTEVVVLP